MGSPNVKRSLKKLRLVLLKAQERELNEADTCMLVAKVLSDVLGYDELSEITAEQRIRDRFVDFAVKINGVTKFLVEVKAAGTKLRERHIDQAESYASRGNIRWALLTNGTAWNLYHLTFEEGIEYEQAFAVDLGSDEISIDEAASQLGLLHRKSVLKGELERFWKERLALNPESLGNALFSEDVLRNIRREIRRRKGFMIDTEDLAKAIRELFAQEAREQMGPLKIRRRRKQQYKPKRGERLEAKVEQAPDGGSSF